jgi:ribonuclease VapC
MIVDSSALIAILRGEPEEHAFRAILEVRKETYISAGTLIEARIMAKSLNVLRELNELVLEFAVRTVAVDDAQAEIASEGFTKYGKGRHPAGLNFAELFAYALAVLRDEPLLFKGDDFAKTDVKCAI